MNTIGHVVEFLQQLAPASLAEPWDNVGLLVGDAEAEVRRVMTCLTVTPASAREAVDTGADLIVTHHPLPFHETKRIVTDNPTGRLLWELISARVSIASFHTAFDSAQTGINERLAVGLGLKNVRPLVESESPDVTGLGSGRLGEPEQATTLAELAQRVTALLGVAGMHAVGGDEQVVRRVGVACGSGGSFLDAARVAGCDCLVTGEATFHTCLAAQSHSISLLLPGHFASERFAMEALAVELAAGFPDLEIWPSQRETDPLRWRSVG